MTESDLYQPVKDLLTAQGYAVKGEIGACDIFALRGDDPPVVVELKTSFTLSLVFQGISRQALTDTVYLAVPVFDGKAARRRRKDALALCRRLGLGLLCIRLGPNPTTEVLTDPAPYRPRKNKALLRHLLGEFDRRAGDTTPGGQSTRAPRMTAYRQDALRCAKFLAAHGPTKAAQVAGATGVDRAATVMRRNVYGWFDKVERGIYTLSQDGQVAIITYEDALSAMGH